MQKLYKILRMTNVSDFNNIYNIQVVIILAVILEYRWQKIKKTLALIRDTSPLLAL